MLSYHRSRSAFLKIKFDRHRVAGRYAASHRKDTGFADIRPYQVTRNFRAAIQSLVPVIPSRFCPPTFSSNDEPEKNVL